MEDRIIEGILDILERTSEPLETKEIEEKLAEFIKKESVTRTKVFYRLTLLRGEGKLKGKFAGPGKGVWIWWGNEVFKTKK